MFLDSSFMKTQFLLNKSLTAETMRHAVISDNIANVDTPYFKRSEVTFESQLKRALDSENPNPFRAKMSSPKHIPFYQPIDLRSVTPKVRLEYDSSFRNDKNNVDVDKEMVNAAKTTLRYNAFTSFTGRNFRKINMLIRG